MQDNNGTFEGLTGDFNFDLPKNRSNVIKVIGVGGGGSNAINYMFQQGIVGVDFVICNTDAQALEKSSVPIKIQLGASLTEGLGAGANPEIGRQSAQESYQDIHQLLSTQTKMVFITAGMGGGTGTGAAPIIAKMAKELDILTVGIVTMPFHFEGKIRVEQAQHGLETLKACVDSLIVINNNKLREVYGNLGFKAGFAKADEVLATAARGIAEVITHHYTQNIDLKDAKTVLSNSGSAIMGSAIAQGSNRAQESVVKALDSPLLNDNKITGCKNVLLLIVSGTEEITIDEIGEINDSIQAEAGNNTNIIMGVGDDPDLGNSISVTIIATGFNSEQQHDIVNTEAKKVIHTLEEDQPLVHDLSSKNQPKTLFPQEKTDHKEDNIIRYLLDQEEEIPQGIEFDKKPEISDEDLSQIEVNYEHVDPALKEIIDSTSFEENEFIEPVNDENPLIHLDEFLTSIEVDAEVLVSEKVTSEQITREIEEDFIFNEITTEINSIEVEDVEIVSYDQEEHQQISFEFDLPIEPKNSLITDEEVRVDDEIDNSINFDDISSIDIEFETVKEGEMELKIVPESTSKSEPLSSDKPNEVTSPFDQSIQSNIRMDNEKRKEQLKQFNYTFNNSINRIDEMERQPAYKRMGFEIDGPAEDDTPSTLSIDNDSNDDIQLRSNNSFLHDNVD